ncbi:MAG: ATP-dependent helicase [Blastocatellia bacterium]|jgi:replicative superfamily II helicase|nr:ATP-dependent helicase [Blastocatellia bacterium]
MIKAAFIGIDKHEHPGIRDLTGARRDALALWALFCDTIPGIEAKLLTNEDARISAIREALEATLGAAADDDTVILSFSGHGTKDHRIVTFDTKLERLINTTISMKELATRFKESRARVVICILDCCFSGGAPARVLDDSPIARDPGFPLEALGGKGRILIAAANINEFAYELPGSGHGLLSKALIDEFEAAGTISLPTVMDRVLERVRADGARIGVVQTPVLFGYVEGGLTLSGLRRGERFFAAFPEVTGIRVTQAIQDLASFGFPPEVLNEWSVNFKAGLNALQLMAVNDHRILDRESLLVVAPTSSGKTFIGEMAALRAIVDGRKAVFLLPYKALVNEKYDQFTHLYGERFGVRVIRCTGDRLDSVAAFVRGKYDLGLLTYEMFLALVLSNPALLNQIGLVVIDEAQFIADPGRGITVELLLTYLLAAREKGINPQLIALSAVIGDIRNFDDWLSCRSLVTSDRPVPLTEGVLDRSGVFEYLDVSGARQTKQLVPPGMIRQRKDKPGSQDVIVPLVQTLLAQNDKEQIIVFRNRRGPAEGCAAYLARDLNLPAATSAIAALPQGDLSAASVTLRRCLTGGTAFHNTNLLPEEKEVVERAFRDPHANVRVLAATTTVAAGINTPASTVILAEQQFVGEDGRQFTVAEYKNMAGRAGRLGFNETGQSIILAGNSFEREVLFQRYVLGELDPLTSSFNSQEIETWVLRLLAQVSQVPRQDIARLLVNTYGGYLAARQNPEWRRDMGTRLEALLKEMIRLGLVDEEGAQVRLSLLGQVCGRSSLCFASVLRLINLLQPLQDHNLTADQLMALIQGLPELDSVFIPLMKTRGKAGRNIAKSETAWPRDAAQRYGHEVVTTLQRNAGDLFYYFARCKRTLLLWDWVRGVSTETIEQKYSVNPYNAISYGHIRGCADTTRFHLRAAHQIALVMFIDRGPSEESVEALLRQLEVGIPAAALDLLALPVSLTRGDYLALHQAGIQKQEDLWLREPSVLAALIGAGSANVLESVRPQADLSKGSLGN